MVVNMHLVTDNHDIINSAILVVGLTAVRELVFLMSDVENRCGGACPFVPMCADAVAEHVTKRKLDLWDKHY
jgi:hypothetical protein